MVKPLSTGFAPILAWFVLAAGCSNRSLPKVDSASGPAQSSCCARTDDARLVELRAWVAAEPTSAERRIQLGRHLLELGRPVEAADELERASMIDPSNPQTALSSAQAYLASNQYEHAAREFERVTARWRNDSEAWN